LDFITRYDLPREQIVSFCDKLSKLANIRHVRYYYFLKSIIIVVFDDFKIEFIKWEYKSLKKPKYYYGIHIDSIEDISANILHASLEQYNSKYFVDLYFIINELHISIFKIIKLMNKKFGNVYSIVDIKNSFKIVKKFKEWPILFRHVSSEYICLYFQQLSNRI
jgi:hypothetical protein